MPFSSQLPPEVPLRCSPHAEHFQKPLFRNILTQQKHFFSSLPHLSLKSFLLPIFFALTLFLLPSTIHASGFSQINVTCQGIDNTGSKDVSAELEALINANPGATFYFPKGTYKIEKPMDITAYGSYVKKMGLIFRGEEGTVIQLDAGMTFEHSKRVYMYDLTFEIKQDGLSFENMCFDTHIEGCTFLGGEPAVTLYNSAYSYVKNCSFSSPEGVFFQRTAGNLNEYAYVDQCTFADGAYGIHTNAMQGMWITGCTFNSEEEGIRISSLESDRSTFGIFITGCSYLNTECGVKMDAVRNYISRVFLTNSYFHASRTGCLIADIRKTAVKYAYSGYFEVSGCTMDGKVQSLPLGSSYNIGLDVYAEENYVDTPASNDSREKNPIKATGKIFMENGVSAVSGKVTDKNGNMLKEYSDYIISGKSVIGVGDYTGIVRLSLSTTQNSMATTSETNNTGAGNSNTGNSNTGNSNSGNTGTTTTGTLTSSTAPETSSIINVVEEGIDNTGKKDVSEQVNELIRNNPGKTLYFPRGYYQFRSPLRIENAEGAGITILGDSRYNSLFVFVGFSDEDCITIDNGTNVVLKNFCPAFYEYYKKQAGFSATGYLIRSLKASNIQLVGLKTWLNHRGVHLDYAEDAQIINCNFNRQNTSSTGSALRICHSEDVLIEQCTFEGNHIYSSGTALYLDYDTDISLKGCDLCNWFGGYGIYAGTSEIRITGTSFMRNKYNIFSRATNLSVTNSFWFNTQYVPSSYLLKAVTADHIDIHSSYAIGDMTLSCSNITEKNLHILGK